MEQESWLDRKVRLLQEKIADLEACLRGDQSSKAWRAIDAELQHSKGVLQSVLEKAENNIPAAYRAYDKRNYLGR